MSITLEERIRRAAIQLDEAVVHDVGRNDVAYLADHPRRSQRTTWVAAAAAMVIGAGAIVAMQARDGSTFVEAPAAQLVDGEGWERLPDSPVSGRFQHLAVSTGTGVLVWGGYGANDNLSDGAFYNAETARWTKVPAAPLARNRGDAVGAWTGTEAVVVNGIHGNVKAAAYNPTANTWRKLPDPPLDNAANMMVRASTVGTDVVVVAVSEEGEGGVRNQVAVLDSSTSTWRISNPPSPSFGSGFDAVVVQSEVVVVGRSGMGGKGCGQAVVQAYDPAANAWRAIPSDVLTVAIPTAVASTGSEVFVVGGPCGDPATAQKAFMLNPRTGLWRAVADAPVGVRGEERYGEVFTGSEVVTFDERTTPVFYEPATNRWRTGVADPLRRKLVETPWAVVQGKLFVFSGGFSGGISTGSTGRCCDALDGGYTYTLRP